MRSFFAEKLLVETPLDTRLYVAITSHFIMEGGGSFFIPADEEYIREGDDKPLAEIIMDKNEECIQRAQPILDIIKRELDEWVKDGGVIQLTYNEE